MSSTSDNKSCLSDKGILRCMDEGKISIVPFNRDNLNTSSYDVTLGTKYYREQQNFGSNIYNMYSEKMVKKVWGNVMEAETYGEWRKNTEGSIELENISPEDKIIWIRPGETILAHTNEIIGGRNTVTTMMKARSSLGRNFIEVCKW